MESKESELIYQAELKRVKGYTRKAIESARKHGLIPPEKIPSLSPEELTNKMRLWRIWVVTLMSLHKKEWNGRRAADYLLEARDVIKKYYYEPYAWEFAKTLKTDLEGHEYQMAAEMCRDEGKYYLYAAGLTGYALFMAEAIDSFNEAISLAEKDTSAWAVATMEKEITKKKEGGKINFPTFRKAYQTAVDLSPQAGGWDRMAAVSWWYVKESLLAGRRNDLRLGLDNLQKATQELGVNWIERYPLRELTTSLLGATRRITAQGISPKQFQI